MAKRSMSDFDKGAAKYEGATPMVLGPAYRAASATTPLSKAPATPNKLTAPGNTKTWFDARKTSTPGSGKAAPATPGQRAGPAPNKPMSKAPPVAIQKPKTNRIGNLGEWAHPPKRKKK